MKNDLKLILFFIFILLFSVIISCQKQDPEAPRFQKQQFLMDTLIEVTLVEQDRKKAELYMDKTFREFERLEKIFTGYDTIGEIYKINNSGGKKMKVNTEIFYLVNTSLTFSEISEGAFDISIWPLIRLWGFGLKSQNVPKVREIIDTLPLVNYKNIRLFQKDGSMQLKPGMGIDMGGIAKGYALDKTAVLLKNAGIKNFIINAGGNIIVGGLKENGEKWRVGIQHPRKNDIIETLEVSDCAVVTSGDYERYFERDKIRYHHILNSSTGYPARNSISATVIVDSHLVANAGTVADALSTAIFILGPEKGILLANTFKGVKTIIIDPDLKITRNY